MKKDLSFNDPASNPMLNEIMSMRKNLDSKLNIIYEMKRKGYDEKEVKKFIKIADDYLTQYYNDITENALTDSVMKLEILSKIAFDKKDYKLVLECQKELNKVLGLHRERIEVSGQVGIYVAQFGSSDPSDSSDPSNGSDGPIDIDFENL